MNNPLKMESQSFDFTLHASGMHAINGSSGDKDGGDEEEVINGIVHNGIIPEGGIYTRGDIVYISGMEYPESLEENDTYQYGDYIYTSFNLDRS